jgi:hypothetical protein
LPLADTPMFPKQWFEHAVHVSIDSELGFENMPEWTEKQRAKSGIRKGDIVEHPKEACFGTSAGPCVAVDTGTCAEGEWIGF